MKKRLILAFIFISVVASCKMNTSLDKKSSMTVEPTKSTPSQPISQPIVKMVDFVSKTGTFEYEVEPGVAKELYFLFSNAGTSNGNISIKQKGVSSTRSVDLNVYENTRKLFPLPAYGNMSAFVEEISDFNNRYVPEKLERNMLSFNTLQKNTIQAKVGDSKSFYDTASKTNVVATLRKTNTQKTAFSDKTLEIWVANSEWNGNVTQKDVDTLSDNFLKAELNNDIYDWVTNMCGEEWGETGYSNVIGKTDTIVILLCDIGNDKATSGTVGYFYSGNNIKKENIRNGASNEAVMFVIDSVFTQNAINDVLSTLAHEFQHMIHFYQRRVKNDFVESETWFNEMLSMCVEDIISDKLGVEGPRGIVGTTAAFNEDNVFARPSNFVERPDKNLEFWANDFYSYANSYSLGAYLIRNFGGAKFINGCFKEKNSGFDAILNVIEANTGKAYKKSDILKRFGVAVLLSDTIGGFEDMVFNNGDNFFQSEIGGTKYNLGAINFFKYLWQTNYDEGTGLVFEEGSLSNKVISSSANVYFYAGKLKEPSTWIITVPKDVYVTVIKK